MNPAEQKANRDELEADLRMLRRAGVKTFKGSGIDVEFFPEAPGAMPEANKDAKDPDLCKCGHPQHAHMNGYCVEGCDASACSEEKPK